MFLDAIACICDAAQHWYNTPILDRLQIRSQIGSRLGYVYICCRVAVRNLHCWGRHKSTWCMMRAGACSSSINAWIDSPNPNYHPELSFHELFHCASRSHTWHSCAGWIQQLAAWGDHSAKSGAINHIFQLHVPSIGSALACDISAFSTIYILGSVFDMFASAKALISIYVFATFHP
jgi:hypothetical protein